MPRPDGTKSARIIQVIETRAMRGMGIDRDPSREVTHCVLNAFAERLFFNGCFAIWVQMNRVILDNEL